MTKKDKILERLRAAYAIAKDSGATIEESIAAWALLTKLAQKYNIEMSTISEESLNDDDGKLDIVKLTDAFHKTTAENPWGYMLLEILAEYHFVKMYVMGELKGRRNDKELRYTLVGDSVNVELTKALFTQVYKGIRDACATEYWKRADEVVQIPTFTQMSRGKDGLVLNAIELAKMDLNYEIVEYLSGRDLTINTDALSDKLWDIRRNEGKSKQTYVVTKKCPSWFEPVKGEDIYYVYLNKRALPQLALLPYWHQHLAAFSQGALKSLRDALKRVRAEFDPETMAVVVYNHETAIEAFVKENMTIGTVKHFTQNAFDEESYNKGLEVGEKIGTSIRAPKINPGQKWLN